MTLLLIQTDVKSVADNPNDLDYSKVTDTADWGVYIGKDSKIVGCIASVSACAGCRTWYVTSDQDGYKRGVGGLRCAAEYIKHRLDTLYRNGLFDDLEHLPGKLELVGICD
jgi:hypothetical protein